MDDLHYLTATDLAERYRSGGLSPVTVCRHYLERIHSLDPALNAFRLIAEERALAAAEAAARQLAAGIDLGPLHGVPYVTKDLFDVAGLPTTAGSRLLEGNVAARDATVTSKLAAAGAVLLGKTNTVEFALGSVGINHSHGTPHNPWAEELHVPGGSSSGSAVAVASGLTALATGTDTACSVRTPAALCGVAGLKTTLGRVSRHGVYPLSSTLDSVGSLARSVTDLAAMFSVMQGSDPGDPSTAGVGAVDALTTLDDGVAGLRVGMAEGLLFDDLDPDVERAVRDCEDVFQDLGARVSRVHFEEADEVMATPSMISVVEGYAVNATFVEQQPERMDPVVLSRMRPGGSVSAVEYRRQLDSLRPLRMRADRRFDSVDVLIGPTSPIAAVPAAEVDADGDTYLGYARRYLRNCFVGNLLNLCAVSVPCGFTRAGLPIGLMIYARAYAEDTALRVARAFERSTVWHRERPELSWAAARR